LSRYHTRAGYRPTVEDSIYVDHRMHRRGIGKAILAHLVERADALGHHSIVASISGDQDASVRLHEGLGFQRVGALREAVHKFDRWLDVVFLQRILAPGRGPGATPSGSSR
jgi:phosphinothricin acetyltransferase